MTDREYYEKRIRPLMPSFGERGSDTDAWERLTEQDRAQISEIRQEEQRIL